MPSLQGRVLGLISRQGHQELRCCRRGSPLNTIQRCGSSAERKQASAVEILGETVFRVETGGWRRGLRSAVASIGTATRRTTCARVVGSHGSASVLQQTRESVGGSQWCSVTQQGSAGCARGRQVVVGTEEAASTSPLLHGNPYTQFVGGPVRVRPQSAIRRR